MTEERTENRSMGQRLKRSFETHVVVPLAVTVVSAATHYLIKKLPLLLEEKVLPKLREQTDAEGVRAAVAETATAVGEKVAGVVPDVEPGDAGDGGDEGEEGDVGKGSAATARPKPRQASDEEREQERQRREERRGERRRAVQKA
jgi:hypothetical protein